MTWPHPLTHPTTPYTHPWVGEPPQISNLQTEWKYLDLFKCYFTDSGSPPGGGGGGWWVKWGFGDDVGMTGTMWGWQAWHGDDRDNMGMTGKMGQTPSIDPPINPPNHPCTHTWVGCVSANHKSPKRIELSWLGQDLFDFLWFDMVPPINPPNHPTTHWTIHPPIGGGVSTDFKSSNGIKISWFVQVLLNFYWVGGSPLGGGVGRWVVKWGFRDDVRVTGMVLGWQKQHGDDGDDMRMMGKTGKTPLSW